MPNYRYKKISIPARPRSALRLFARGATAGGSSSSVSVSGFSEGATHDHANLNILAALGRTGNYATWSDVDETGEFVTSKIWAGYADLAANALHADLAAEADHAKRATVADDSVLWSGRVFEDWLDQPVRKGDDVSFAGVTTRKITNPDFVPDLVGGHGFSMVQDPESGKASIWADEMFVRGGLHVVTIEMQKVDSVGGVLLVSEGAAQVRGQVVMDGRIGVELDLRKGETSVNSPYRIEGCPFEIGDFARWGRLNRETGSYRAGWMEISDIAILQGEDGPRYILFFDLETRTPIYTEDGDQISTEDSLFIIATEPDGASLPDEGDNIVLMGSKTRGRDGFIVISSENGKPHISAYEGVNTLAMPTPRARFGNLDGIVDSRFGELSGYGFWSDNVFLKGLFRLKNDDGTYVDISDKIQLIVKDELTPTGIDIEQKKITATADNFVVRNNAGVETMAIDGDGRLKTQLINAAELQVQHLSCFDPTDPNIVTSTFNRNGRGELINYYRDQDSELKPATVQEWEDETGILIKGYDKNGLLKWSFGRGGYREYDPDYTFIRFPLSNLTAEQASKVQRYASTDYFRLSYPGDDRDGLVMTSDFLDAPKIPDGRYYDPAPILRLVPDIEDIPQSGAGYRSFYDYQNGRLVATGKITVS